MARDASSSGDRIAAENYYQHAEHYFRILSVQREEAEARAAASQRSNGNENGSGRRSRQDPLQETAGYGTEAHDQPEVEGSEMPAFVTKKVPEPPEKTSEQSEQEEVKVESAVGDD